MSIILTAFVAIATAHSPNPNGNCSNVGDDTLELAGVPVAVTVPGEATLYLGDDMTLWTEDNDWPGLQTHTHTCRSGGQTLTIGADTPLAL